MRISYPDLPVSRRREELLAAMRKSRVVVVVGETGSGKTTQLPKMALELAIQDGSEGRIGCTQPRRLAATSVARRVAEEMGEEVGATVGYQVRFDDKTGKDTAIKFMTDGILLAETQRDRQLRQYHTIIIDEAHERSLNIDFLLGYLKRLLKKRRDLRVLISSATLDAGGFSEFFGGAPVVEVEGRTYPVEDHFLPPLMEGEDLSQHVNRAVEWIYGADDRGDLLVFLPGEREIRECAKLLDGNNYPNTEVLPVFARLSMADQQRVFQKSRRRRIVLATNVAETSLTIPGVVYVIDPGWARISRFSPTRQVQRLQVERISQASARQRRGRCGRVREGVCVKLYDEETWEGLAEFTDPEIRRTSLAGVMLQMLGLGLGDIADFPFLDPPSKKAVSEGAQTLEEVEAIGKGRDKDGQRYALTEMGKKLARLPLDPRLGRMLVAAQERRVLEEVTVIVGGLSVQDVRDRPSEKEDAADRAHQKFCDRDSDFMSLLLIWSGLREFRKEKGGWHRNQLRRYCEKNFLNFRRVLEWEQVVGELKRLMAEQYRWRVRVLSADRREWGEYSEIHKALLVGMPRQVGEWNPEKGKRFYQGTGGRQFAVFPGSGLFGEKRPPWVLAFELVETTRLWARKVAKLEPEWVEEVAPHLCRYRYHSPYWEAQQGAVYGLETVIFSGLTLLPQRRVHFGRVDPKSSHEVFVQEAILGDGIRGNCACLDQLKAVRDEVGRLEHKLRRVGGLWSDEGAYDFYFERIPVGISTAKDFHDWRSKGENEEGLMIRVADVVWEEIASEALLFPDEVEHGGRTWPVVYLCDPEVVGDGVTFEIGIEEVLRFPDFLASWGVPGIMEDRVELLIRSLPKAERTLILPVKPAVEEFINTWTGWEPQVELREALAEFLAERCGREIRAEQFDEEKLPVCLRPHVRVRDEKGKVLAFGDDVALVRERLAAELHSRREESANAEWEMTGGEYWSYGEIPEEAGLSEHLVGEGTATGVYPGLVDEGETVGLRAFLKKEDSDESHRAGCVRLFLLDQAEQVEYVRRRLPLGPEVRLFLGGGNAGWEDELLRVAAEGAIRDERGNLPRSEAAFAEAAKRGKARLYEAVRELSESMAEVAAARERVQEWLEFFRPNKNVESVIADVEEELMWLFRPCWIWRAGFGRLRRYQRYLYALEERFQRLESQPYVRDEEKQTQVWALWDRWLRQWQERPDAAWLWEAGWMLEEWRIALFAPSQPREMKVSGKRIERVLER